MNKTLRLLFLSGLAAISCASCSKVEQLFPESFERNDKPFSVEAVPQEGYDTLIFFRIKGNDSIKTQFYPTDTTLKFKVGDSIILEARAKNGYTFINWVRDGNGVSDNPIYGFKLDSLDIDKSTHFVKHHYEARFGLDYALQVIPPIDSIIPAELIAAMGDYLYFGDTPPRIDRGYFSAIDFIYIDTLIRKDTSEIYYISSPQPIDYPRNTFIFEGQHRCMATSYYYERCTFLDYYYDYAKADTVYIMGYDSCFTAYFQQTLGEWHHETLHQNLQHLEGVTRRENVIMSGIVSNEGIKEFHWATQVESYNPSTHPYIGTTGQPGIHDIIIYSYREGESNLLLPYDPTFQRHPF